MRSLLWGAAVLLLFYGLHAAEPLFVSTGILRAGTRSPDRVITVGEEIEFEVTLVAPREQGIDFQFVGNLYSSWEVTSASATRGIPKIERTKEGYSISLEDNVVPGEPFIIRYSANINALKLSCETVALQVDTSVRLKNSSEIVESSFFVLVQDSSAPKIDMLSTRDRGIPYNEECGNFRVRKEWRHLSEDEQQHFLTVLRKMQDDLPWFTEWVDALRKERPKPDPARWLFRAHTEGVAFEKFLQQIDPDFVLPYWDFAYDVSTHNGAENSVIWDPKNFGPDGKGKCVDLSKSPLNGWRTRTSNGNLPCLIRKFSNPQTKVRGQLGAVGRPEFDRAVGETKNLTDFATNVGKIHVALHYGIGGDLDGLSGYNEPLFYTLHGVFDRVYLEGLKKPGFLPDMDTVDFRVSSVPGLKGKTLAYFNDPQKLCYTYDPRPERSDQYAAGVMTPRTIPETKRTPKKECSQMAEDLRAFPPPLVEYLLPLSGRSGVDAALFHLIKPQVGGGQSVCLPSEAREYRRTVAARSMKQQQQQQPPFARRAQEGTTSDLPPQKKKDGGNSGLEFALWTALVVESYEGCTDILFEETSEGEGEGEETRREKGSLVDRVASALLLSKLGKAPERQGRAMFEELAMMFGKRDQLKEEEFFAMGVRVRNFLASL